MEALRYDLQEKNRGVKDTNKVGALQLWRNENPVIGKKQTKKHMVMHTLLEEKILTIFAKQTG